MSRTTVELRLLNQVPINNNIINNIIFQEDAAMVTKLLFVRLITKGRKIVVCLFVG